MSTEAGAIQLFIRPDAASRHGLIQVLGGMMSFEVVPLKGVGSVFLGMPRAEVHAVLGNRFLSFRKTAVALHPTDAWFENSFQVFYSGSAPAVEYIELSESRIFSASLLGRAVFGISAPELVRHIQKYAVADTTDPEHGLSYIFPALELSVWRPTLQDERFATIGIGQIGYYSDAA